MTTKEIKKEYDCDSKIIVTGEIIEAPAYSHSNNKTQFYNVTIKSKRQSGTIDYLPIVVSENTLDEYKNTYGELTAGTHVEITGHVGSFNRPIEPETINPKTGRRKTQLCVRVYAKTIRPVGKTDADTNDVVIKGFLASEPILRKTPLGRQICDTMVAVNALTRKRSNYLPTICWRETAAFASKLELGSKIIIKGRLQSRVYTKTNPETKDVTEHITYEISAAYITLADTDDDTTKTTQE